MFEKIAIVGDSDLVFAFRALGVKVFSPKTAEDAKNVTASLERENFGLCLLHESFLEPVEEERKALEKKFCPVIVGFSDYRAVTDTIEKIMRGMAVKATGSDFLVKRKG